MATALPAINARSYVDALLQMGARPSPAGWTQAVPSSAIGARLGALIGSDIAPDQGTTSLCGPAAFCYALLQDDPTTFARAIYELWMTGRSTIGKLDLTTSAGLRTSYRDGAGRFADWVLLGSLRFSGGGLWPVQPTYTRADQDIQAITLPHVLAGWFKAAGSTVQSSYWLLHGPLQAAAFGLSAGVSPLLPPAILSGGLVDSAAELHRLDVARSARRWLPMLINAALLGNKAGISMTPNHWVMLNRSVPITLRENPAALWSQADVDLTNQERALARTAERAILPGIRFEPFGLPPSRAAEPPLRFGKPHVTAAELVPGQRLIGRSRLEDALIGMEVVTWGNTRRTLRTVPMTVATFFQNYYGHVSATCLRTRSGIGA